MNEQENKPRKKAGWIIGSAVILIGASILYYFLDKQKKDADEDARIQAQVASDYIKAKKALEDSIRIQDSIINSIPKNSDGSPFYTGTFDNIIGGILSIKPSGDSLRIELVYNSRIGQNCAGKISGWGIYSGNYTVTMTTSEGCRLDISINASTATVKESASCKIYHGKNCSFGGVYIRK
jgi:hypothetical protein